VPAIISWPQRIPAGQVVHEAGIATDVFPTLIKAAGGDISGYECDGMDILPALCGEGSIPERELFWEYEEQTAFREGDFKLVLNGRLEEGTPPEDAVHLANLADDLGERVNLKDVYPEITERMVKAAVKWRQGMEERRG
jgi:arylsulfatase A-like enzyme